MRVVWISLLLLTACAEKGTSLGRIGGAPSLILTVPLTAPDGTPRGTATLSQEVDGTRITARVIGVPPGDYSISLHGSGRCESPDFASVGTPIGGGNALTVDASGLGLLNVLREDVRLQGGLLDADGAAVVLNGAVRLACGSLTMGH